MGGASTGQVALAVLATLVIAWWELDAWTLMNALRGLMVVPVALVDARTPLVPIHATATQGTS